jgi:ABC-type multidrug transport system fused ATPase/permease subunit
MLAELVAAILAVAHRLNTLLDYDEIIVLSRGRIVEQGSPGELMSRPQGAFSMLLSGMVREEGQEIELAEEF